MQQRRRLNELITRERPLVLTDHHRIQAARRNIQRRQQRAGLRTLRPRQPPRTPGIEELRHDHTPARDELVSSLTLTAGRRRPILILHRRHPPIERKPQARRPPPRPTDPIPERHNVLPAHRTCYTRH
ncbi:hypothetical protein ACH35V_32685 [Actinomadura sp. 1N219]|uniref:hypothetical protein n=1 Tax=Actinomadura sp. 1N219 TaxID=3375152 RepID=UPI003791E03E